MEIKTEADSDDTTECPHDDWPTSRTFGIFLILYSLHSFLVFTLFYICKQKLSYHKQSTRQLCTQLRASTGLNITL